jgi:hypothetical protein
MSRLCDSPASSCVSASPDWPAKRILRWGLGITRLQPPGRGYVATGRRRYVTVLIIWINVEFRERAFADTVYRFAVYRDRLPFAEPAGRWPFAATATVFRARPPQERITANGHGDRSRPSVSGQRARPTANRLGKRQNGKLYRQTRFPEFRDEPKE